jgi:hypothetical protein
VTRLRLVALAVLLGALAPLAPPSPVTAVAPAAASRAFGDDPLDDVLHWAAEERRCGLTTNKLAALMLAPTYPETGTPMGQAPAPMTLSRWDNQAGLHSFATVAAQPRAFWHPGVGMWQFDSAGLGAPFTAAQSIDTFVVSAQTAATMASRWCTDPSLAYVWAPWFGCGTSTCRTIFDAVYRRATDRLVGVTRDADVSSRGGMTRHTCTGPAQPEAFTCWRVDPALAQGYAGFTASGFGPAPLTAPFFVYAANGKEYRHWLRADTGYRRGVWASRPLGANARTSLTWHRGDGLVDLGAGTAGGAGGGGGAGFVDVAPSAWYLDALVWGRDTGLVAGFDDGTFRPAAPVTRAQAVAWLWAEAGRPIPAATRSFTDVGAQAWFADALTWAAGEGIVVGFGDGSFRPADPVSRAQLASMLWHRADRPPSAGPEAFADVVADAWYGPAVSWIAEMGYTDGLRDGTFRPAGPVTRAQSVSWLHAARQFDDVAAGAWYEAAVDWGRYRRVVAGYDDHTFRGQVISDRAMTVSMLWAFADAPVGAPAHGFSDVTTDDPSVSWAAAAGVAGGFPDGTFRPTEPVNRAQAVMMLWSIAGRPQGAGPPAFTDVSPGAWCAPGVAWAAARGIADGYADGTFRATEPVTRAQLAVQLSTLAHTAEAWSPAATIPATVVFAS